MQALLVHQLLFLLFLKLAFTSADEIKISHVNILLPWSPEENAQENGGNDVLEDRRDMVIYAKPGCFVWASSAPSVATVEPLYHNETERNSGCSSRAIVRAVWHQRKRAKAVVKAKEKDTTTGVLGYDLRCEVWVAPIQSVTILTTVRKLSLGTTEKVEVQAFDDGNNVFSSLAGLRFDWAAPNRDILRVLRLSETKVDATFSQREMERRGMLTNSVQIEGVKTGRGNITVRLSEQGYENIPLASVDINVSRPLELEPKNARYLAPSSELQMELYTYDKKVYKQINMPTAQYKWETGDDTVASIDVNTGMVVGVGKGTTDIVARDQEITENQDTHGLDVSHPASMHVIITPAEDELAPTTMEQQRTSGVHVTDSRVWHVVKGRDYAVRVVLRDEEHRTMYITRNMEFDVRYGVAIAGDESGEEDKNKEEEEGTSSSSFVGRVTSNPNLPPDNYASGDSVKRRAEWSVQRRWIKATNVGKTNVRGTMLPVKSEVMNTVWKPEHEINTFSEIVVSDPVSLSRPNDPTPILLPPLEQQYQLRAAGGTGRYLWKSADSELASIGPTGNITVHVAEGTTEIQVSDEQNKRNDARADVEIAKVADIVFLAGPIEAEVDVTQNGNKGDGDGSSDLYVHIGAVDDKRRLFHACTSLYEDIDVVIDDKNKNFRLVEKFVGPSPLDISSTGGMSEADEALYARSCVTLRLRPLRAGKTQVRVAYGKKYQAEVEISAFPPLRWVIPGKSLNGEHIAIVSLHSTATVQLVGGPQPRGNSLGSFSIDSWSLEDESTVRVREHDAGSHIGTTRDAFVHVKGKDGFSQGRLYSLECRERGEQEITFTVANDRRALISDDMLDVSPVVRSARLRFICTDPSHTQIVMQKTATVESTPTSSNGEEPSYYVRTLAPVPIYVRVLDDQFRPFINFSTIATKWNVDGDEENQRVGSEGGILDLAHRRCAQNETLLNSVDEYGNVDIALAVDCDQVGPFGQDGTYPGTMRDLIVVGGGVDQGGLQEHAMVQRQYLFGYGEGVARVKVTTQVCPAYLLGTMQTEVKKKKKTYDCPEKPLVRSSRLQLVKNVRLSPRRTILYRQPTNSLTVQAIGGTGQFSFKFDNPEGTIAELRQNSSVSVEVEPREDNGRVTVEVSDIGLTETSVAISEITLSDVLSLDIRVQGDKIARGASRSLYLKASTYDEAWFPTSQLALMDIDFENASATHVGISFEPCKHDESVVENKRGFCLTGIKVGTTELRAYVRHHDGRIVSSQPLSITVFEPLRLSPRRLVLLPGSTFDIDHIGGPKTKISYNTTNRSVAMVDSKGLVTTLGLGDCIVRVEAIGMYALTGQKVVHARDAIPVRVSLLEEIEIVSPSRKLLVGNEIKLRVRGRSGESPFTFGTAKVKFDWSSEKTNILSIEHHGKYGDNDKDSAIGRDYAVWVTAASPGKTKISVTVTSSPVGESAIDGATLHFPTQILTAELVVLVDHPLLLLSPPTLLMWPGSTARIRTNSDRSEPLFYRQSVVDSGFPKMVEFVNGEKCTGKIRAGTVPGRSTVYVFNRAQDQSLSVNVEVKDVAQLRVVGNTNLYVGEASVLDVVVVDDMGRTFDMDILNLKFIQNAEEFSIQPGTTKNNTFKVIAKSEGETIVKFHLSTTGPAEITVSVNSAEELGNYNTAIPPKVNEHGTADVLEAHTYLSDYITLRSVHRLYPNARPVHVHVGGEVQFSSQSNSQVWSSSDSDVLSVNSSTGNTRAKNVGSAYVKHQGTHRSINRAQVSVHRVERIEMNTSSIDFIVPSEEYTFPIRMYGYGDGDGHGQVGEEAEHHLLVNDDTVDQNIHLDCHYNMNAVGGAGGSSGSLLDDSAVQVRSVYDVTSKQYACVVKVQDTSSTFSSKENEFPNAKSLQLTAEVSDKTENSRGTYTLRQPLDNVIRFIPNLRLRIRYPHDLVSLSSSRKKTTAASRRGKVLLGCIELQQKTPFAYLEVYVRSDVASTPLEISRPPEITIDKEEEAVDPLGWTKFTYKIAARNREVPFKEVSLIFTHRESNQDQDVCVTYRQKHEHQWYCAVRDSTTAPDGSTTPYRRQYCYQCPSIGSGSTTNNMQGDTRQRVIKCCVPNTGKECTNEQVTDSYHCNGSPKPPTDCGDFNLGAKGEDVRDARAEWDDVSDTSLSRYVITMIGVLVGVVYFGGKLWQIANETLRKTVCCREVRRNPRGERMQRAFGAVHQDVPGGQFDAAHHQRRARGVNPMNRVNRPAAARQLVQDPDELWALH